MCQPLIPYARGVVQLHNSDSPRFRCTIFSSTTSTRFVLLILIPPPGLLCFVPSWFVCGGARTKIADATVIIELIGVGHLNRLSNRLRNLRNIWFLGGGAVTMHTL
ncbi:hypothetical protein CCHOA_03255 [Corynebacterium choanae]|uniref:Uncharacterized protein n=1 Tax=Corynebacterium choanae TaxID=1862358 RepID=A0A3G6J5M2_9CORY|nr:hypothetical protein CCHOA_03255 [Corynebacterium choanae]